MLEHDGRTYRLYVPSCCSHEMAAPMVVAFHGAGDSGANFYAVAKATGWSSAEMDEIREIVDLSSEHYNLDRSQLYGFGFSDGGLFVVVTELEHSRQLLWVRAGFRHLCVGAGISGKFTSGVGLGPRRHRPYGPIPA